MQKQRLLFLLPLLRPPPLPLLRPPLPLLHIAAKQLLLPLLLPLIAVTLLPLPWSLLTIAVKLLLPPLLPPKITEMRPLLPLEPLLR